MEILNRPKPVEKKPTYEEAAPLLSGLGVKESFVDKEEPAPKPPKPPKPVITKEKAEAVVEELKEVPSYSEVAKKAGVKVSEVAEIDKERKATWALKAEKVADVEGEL